MPNTIGQYRAGKVLGHGAYGTVKLGHHLKSGEKVAIKMLAKTTINQVRQECNIQRQLDHPNIVKLLDVVQTDHNICIIMENVSGGDLFDYVAQKGQLSECEARNKFNMIMRGVEYCHKLNIAHRDLKLENILVDQGKENVKIADFGLSIEMKPGTLLSDACGSLAYAAPELFGNGGFCKYDGRAVDVWSSGIMLYAMLYGRFPFNANTT